MQSPNGVERRYREVFGMVAAFKQDGRHVTENGTVLPGILEQKDKFGREFLVNAIRGEIQEFSIELNKFPIGASLEVTRALLDEFYDIMVFLICLYQAQAPHIDPLSALHSLNGAGAHSNAVQELDNHVGELEFDLSELPLVFAHMHSMSKHLPVTVPHLAGIEQTINKAWNNRRGMAFTMYDPIERRVLTEDEAMADKEPHVEFVLRTLRKIHGRMLQESDYRENWEAINAWRHTTAIQAELKAKLAAKTAQNKLPREINEITVYSHMPVHVVQQ